MFPAVRQELVSFAQNRREQISALEGSPYAAKTDIGKAMNGTQYVISLQPENGPRLQKPERKVG